jgi:hypothetical protein
VIEVFGTFNRLTVVPQLKHKDGHYVTGNDLHAYLDGVLEQLVRSATTGNPGEILQRSPVVRDPEVERQRRVGHVRVFACLDDEKPPPELQKEATP